ncbi:MAG TPA: sigma-70 family RNA polymerase sigma factor [Rubricoccaceae bacterium]|jgi:RNA polymerase sigma-70 factor (ECF subfamily)
MPAAALFETYRPALTGHCYRMLGSIADAEDAVQESLVRAWRASDRFEERAALQTWLTRIATNVCLDTLAATRQRRTRPVDLGTPPAVAPEPCDLVVHPAEVWIEPAPDAAVLPAEGDPEQRAVLRESVRLAFVAALQFLPPRQRAVLLLTQVLSWSAAEAAEALGMTVPAVNSALQRARATLDARNPTVVPRALSAEQQDLVGRYVAAFEAYDVDALAALLHEEAALSMPPYSLWLRGPAEIARWLLGPGSPCRGSRLVPVETGGGAPAFAQYRDGGATPWALLVLDLDGARITSMTSYLDTEALFPRFGLPMRLA